MSQLPPPQLSAALDDAHEPLPLTALESAPLTTRGGPASPVPRALYRIWRLVTMNRKVTAGAIIVALFVFVAIFGPLFVTQDPFKFTLNLLAPPSSAHLLGTNQGGQDVFSQLVIGTRSSVFWAFVTGLLVVGIAVTVGLVSGYFGGAVDDVFSLITNVFLVIPAFPLAIVAVEFFNRSTVTIALIVAFTNWPWGARVIRAQTLSMRNREFVTAARANGESTWRLIFYDILPNETSIVAASFITTTIQVLLAVAGLEFLGFGDSGSTISWGIMLNAAYNGQALLQGSWWWFAPPGICIALLGSGLALLNFGIDEIADPRLRQVKRRVRDEARAARSAMLSGMMNSGKRARLQPGKESDA
jgi:peptide/nickel transport system permease protein